MEEQEIRLNSSEWTMMECLWEKSPQTLTELTRAMEAERGWAKSTTKTVLKRMEQKKYLYYREGGKAREYYPALRREEVVEVETNQFLNRIYHGSLGLLVNTLVKKQGLSEADLEELRKILDAAKGKEGNGNENTDVSDTR